MLSQNSFQSLKTNQAVRIGDTLIVNLDNHTKYVTKGGNEFTTGYNNQTNIRVDALPIYKVVPPKQKLVGYKNGNNFYTVKQYMEMGRKITAHIETDEDDELLFKNLDEEFEVRKALAKLEAFERQYEIETFEPELVEIELVAILEDCNDDAIEQSLSIGQVGFNGGGPVRVNISKVMNRVFDRFVADHKVSEYDKGNNVKFWKLRGKHVFYDFPNQDQQVRVFPNVTQAVVFVKDLEKRAYNHIKIKILGDTVGINSLGISCSVMVDRLRSIRTKSQSMDVKIKAESDKRQLLQLVDTLIAQVEKSFEENC